MSVSTTLVATLGPLFRTVSTYVRVFPTLTGSGASEIRSDRLTAPPVSMHLSAGPSGGQVTVPCSNFAVVELSGFVETSVIGNPRCPE